MPGATGWVCPLTWPVGFRSASGANRLKMWHQLLEATWGIWRQSLLTCSANLLWRFLPGISRPEPWLGSWWRSVFLNMGRNFESNLIQQLCSLYKVGRSRSSPYHPAGNGQCERFNRTLHNLLRTLPTDRKRDWASCLAHVLFCYNTRPLGSLPFSWWLGKSQSCL